MVQVHILSIRFRKCWHFCKSFNTFDEAFNWLKRPKGVLYYQFTYGIIKERYYRITVDKDCISYYKVLDNSPFENRIFYSNIDNIIDVYPFVKDIKNALY